nr:putative disease resistance protein RGA1 [Quercus suber]
MGSGSTTIYSKEKDINEKTRHVSFGHTLYSSSEIPISLYKARRIRTFLLPCQPGYNSIKSNDSTFSEIIASFKFINLLDLHNMGIKTIPCSIKNLKHLRYLDLSMNEDIKMLPNSIVKLYNLQTLKLFGCGSLKELPKDINKLINLRFLEIDGCWGLTHMPNGLGQLTNLQTLSRFVMSKGSIDSVNRNSGGLKELAKLNELRDSLSIENLRHEKDAALEYKDANLKEKQRLDRLDLNWVYEAIDETGVGYNDMSLEALQPHINLKGLRLERYGGVIFPHWLVSLTNLVQLKLDSCKKCQYLPPLDQFPSLKIIYLIRLDSLEHISDLERDNDDSLFYPSLKGLLIDGCPNLKGWWRGRRDSLPSFPRLSYLQISNCPQLTSFPLFPYLESLSLINCSLNLKQSLERMMINNKTSGNLQSITSYSYSYSSSTIVAPLSKLSYMCIGEMEEALPEECLQNLISLRTLHIHKCPLPQGTRYLTALQELLVQYFEEVDFSNDWDEMEWQGLRTLLSLQFLDLPKLVSLPMGLQYVSSLQNLQIYLCGSLIAIPEWICKLISLQSLEIWHCPKLESLPEGFGALTSLQTLDIRGCPILLKRCKKQIGEDWHKISHIPNLKGALSQQEEEPGI